MPKNPCHPTSTEQASPALTIAQENIHHTLALTTADAVSLSIFLENESIHELPLPDR